MRNPHILLLILLTLSACHTQQHTVTTADNHTQQSAVTNSSQVVNAFDSLLHQLDFSADSVVITVAYENNAVGVVGAYGYANDENNERSEATLFRLTAHRPHLTSQATKTMQTTQTTSEAQTTQTTATTQTTQTADKTQTVIASPMNGTAVVITISIALLLILAALAYFFLKKYKII